MKEWLVFVTEYCVLAIDALALVVIMVGTIEAVFKGAALMFGSSNSHERRDVWMHYARWLVAGLTFQLAADILETAIAPDWDDVGRLAVDRHHSHAAQLLSRAGSGRGSTTSTRGDRCRH